jgi:3-hydroxymyristoyl/3-hydroxydecanoyl-(acyl carrier protein) dehydratase
MAYRSGIVELSHERVHDGGLDEHRFVLTVPADLPAFEGHFPSSPILPAFIQLSEIVARVNRVCPDLGTWAGASAVKFTSPIRPGAQVVLRLRPGSGGQQVRFTVSVANTVCASGALTFAVAEAGPA